MKHIGRGVIRLNDTTDHGGRVTSASSGTVVMGIVAAMAGDMTHCPKCKGDFAITPDGAGAKHQGKPYAYQNDTTACGAKLIASLK
ncbi:MAG: PAAR domain-containing protein [Pseudomonadota bacterium]